jgi:hypothetical protein
MRLSEAELGSNLEYWKRVADRYRLQRDTALKEVHRLQQELLRTTGKAHDGLDYLRDIQRTETKLPLTKRIIYFLRRDR